MTETIYLAFAEPDEIEDSKLLWESQIDDLKKILGS